MEYYRFWHHATPEERSAIRQTPPEILEPLRELIRTARRRLAEDGSVLRGSHLYTRCVTLRHNQRLYQIKDLNYGFRTAGRHPNEDCGFFISVAELHGEHQLIGRSHDIQTASDPDWLTLTGSFILRAIRPETLLLAREEIDAAFVFPAEGWDNLIAEVTSRLES